MVATALRVDFGSAAVTEIGSSRGQLLAFEEVGGV